jgi:hypothetical protein
LPEKIFFGVDISFELCKKKSPYSERSPLEGVVEASFILFVSTKQMGAAR